MRELTYSELTKTSAGITNLEVMWTMGHIGGAIGGIAGSIFGITATIGTGTFTPLLILPLLGVVVGYGAGIGLGQEVIKEKIYQDMLNKEF